MQLWGASSAKLKKVKGLQKCNKTLERVSEGSD